MPATLNMQNWSSLAPAASQGRRSRKETSVRWLHATERQLALMYGRG